MKQSDLRPCALCGQGMMHAGSPIFYRVTVDHMVVDLGAAQRQHGLEMMMGPAASLAQVLGPDEDMAKQASRVTALVCQECALSPASALLHIAFPEDDG